MVGLHPSPFSYFYYLCSIHGGIATPLICEDVFPQDGHDIYVLEVVPCPQIR